MFTNRQRSTGVYGMFYVLAIIFEFIVHIVSKHEHLVANAKNDDIV